MPKNLAKINVHLINQHLCQGPACDALKYCLHRELTILIHVTLA